MDFIAFITALIAALTTLAGPSPAPAPDPAPRHHVTPTERAVTPKPQPADDDVATEGDPDFTDICDTPGDPDWEAVPDEGQTQAQAEADLAAFCEDDQ